MKITFGRNSDQERHTFRHVNEAALDVVQIRLLILQDLEWRAEQIGLGLFRSQILYQGVLLEYRAFKFEDRSINVGGITLI